MRIGLDISQLAYPNSGVAIYTVELVKYLLKMDKENEYVLFGSSFRRQSYLNKRTWDDSARVKTCLYYFPQSFLRTLWNRFHIVPIENFLGRLDVFHSSDWIEPPAKAKKVTTIHDLLVYKFAQYMHPSIVENQKQKLSWVKKECTKIIVDSQSTKDDVMEILGIEEERLRVIYLGVGEEFVPQTKEKIATIRKKYHLEKDYIMSVGSIEPRKNIDRVITAFKNLDKKDEFTLAIIGRFAWGNRLDLGHGIMTLPTVEREDLPALYSGARCFVYPSLYEGFGLPILEAMSCGCPVITSDRGSLKEVAGNYAIIVDPVNDDLLYEAIKMILSASETHRTKRIKEGQEWVKQFSWEKTARQTKAVYEELKS